MKKLSLVLILAFRLFGADGLAFTTLYSDFTQIVKSGDKKITYSGYFIADKENGAFWHYKKPIEKFIYFNKKKVTIIEPELEQAIITSLKESPNITQILKDSKEISKNHFIAIYDGIHYDIEVENRVAKEISYTDRLDNFVKIELSNTKKDGLINKELLTPKIPSNFDILSN